MAHFEEAKGSPTGRNDTNPLSQEQLRPALHIPSGDGTVTGQFMAAVQQEGSYLDVLQLN